MRGLQVTQAAMLEAGALCRDEKSVALAFFDRATMTSFLDKQV
jgi:hypothetical protein